MDNRKELELPHWAGVIPFRTVVKKPIPDPDLAKDIEPGESVKNFEL